MIDYLEKILTANVYDVAIESPLDKARNLSAKLDNQIWLKREDLQPVFSFKLRGAYNKMVNLSPEALKAGVICASAGNHAQGVALAAEKLGCTATIVMPVTTPQIKIDAVRKRGGIVVLVGDSYQEAFTHSQIMRREQNLTFIPPYDDPLIIAGQGTIGMEILHQHRKPIDAIFVPIGGGGLISGIAAFVKRVRPEIKIIGVETFDADAMCESLRANERITLPNVGLFADGTAVKQVGEETFRLARDLVDEVILVDTDSICAAIKDVFDDTRAILEPSGALSVAGLKAYVEREKVKDKTFIAIASGANMNFGRLRFVTERSDVGERREALFAITIPEERGSFRRFCELIGPRNVTEFNYRIADAKEAHIFVGLEVRDKEDIVNLANTMRSHQFQTLDLTDDEMAKSHLRHLVGGRSHLAENELVYRFNFPERPGALIGFLSSMSPNWNISLFHYRNHGADYGRILIGLQVPPADKEIFNKFLKDLRYEYADESNNPAYHLFLG